MNKEELRKEFIRLNQLNSIKDCINLIDIYLDFFWEIMKKQQGKEYDSYANKDASIIKQMMFSKLLHIRKNVSGVSYKAKDNSSLNVIVDPTVIATLTRNVYETVAVFNLIYRNSNTTDEKAIIYGLWTISGLKYRQRFISVAKSPDSKNKIKEEQEIIEKIEYEIRSTELYKSLDQKNTEKIEEKIKNKDYKILFNGKNVVFLSWQGMCDVMKLDKELFDDIYTYFSLYSHPTQVSVFQFEQMFNREKSEFIELTRIITKYCISLYSIFIADYIELFPELKTEFEKLHILKQLAINSHNKMLRSNEYSINESWKILE